MNPSRRFDSKIKLPSFTGEIWYWTCSVSSCFLFIFFSSSFSSSLCFCLLFFFSFRCFVILHHSDTVILAQEGRARYRENSKKPLTTYRHRIGLLARRKIHLLYPWALLANSVYTCSKNEVFFKWFVWLSRKLGTVACAFGTQNPKIKEIRKAVGWP